MKFILVLAAVLCAAQSQTTTIPDCVTEVITNLNVGGVPCENYMELINPDGPTINNTELGKLCSLVNPCTSALEALLTAQCGLSDVIPLLCASSVSGYCFRRRTEFSDLISSPCAGGCSADRFGCEIAMAYFGCCANAIVTYANMVGDQGFPDDCTLPMICEDGPPPTDTPIPRSVCYQNNRVDLASEVSGECADVFQRLIDPVNNRTETELEQLCDDELCAPQIHRFLVERCDSNIVRAVCSKQDENFCLVNSERYLEEVRAVADFQCDGGTESCISNSFCRDAVLNLTCCNDASLAFGEFSGVRVPLPNDCSIAECAIPPGLESGAITLHSTSVWLLLAGVLILLLNV